MSKSATLDITDDLTEQQLAGVSMTEETVVSFGDRVHGIIVGYQDQDPMGSGPGVFTIAVVAIKNADTLQWEETGREVKLTRRDFVVIGPANREPEHRQTGAESKPGVNPFWGTPEELNPFLACLADLLAYQTEVNEPTYNVRLDVQARDGGPHQYRLLVRPVVQPMLHDEIHDCLEVANKYNLAATLGQHGIEIRYPYDLSSD